MRNDFSISESDASFEAILADYLEQLQQDRSIDRERVRLDHPTHADSICQFLDNHDRLREALGATSTSLVGLGSILPDAGTARWSGSGTQLGTVQSKADLLCCQANWKRIGDYEILEEIDRGGMGVVFKARHVELRCLVALKMILSGRLATTSDIDRFQREARAAANLRHPNIVVVHGFGSHEGNHYFTMDFIDGQSLAEKLREGPMPPREAARLMKSIAEAVQYAHERNVVHRDIKPANVILDKRGEPYLTDFGLAKVKLADEGDASDQLTGAGQILGTPSFMSPEQAAGRNQSVGVASDVYSLGAILYACLAGRAPFVADSAIDTLKQVLEHEPAQPRVVNPRVPKDLQTICMKCLRKEPHRRYSSAETLAVDLGRFLAGRPILAKPTRLHTHALKWCRRRPDVTALLAFLGALLVVGVLSVGFWWREAERRSRDAEQASAAANQNLHNSRVRQAESDRRARLSGYRNRVWALLQTASQMPGVDIDRDAIRQEAVACLGDFVGLQPLTIDAPLLDGSKNCVTFIDDRRVAVALSNGDVSIRELVTGNEHMRIVRSGMAGQDMITANDGTTLLIADGIVLQCWNQDADDAWSVQWEVPLSMPSIYMHMTQAGDTVAVAQGQRIRLLRMDDGEAIRTLEPPPSYEFRQKRFGFLTVAASPDGRFVAAADDPQSIFVWDANTGDLLERIRAPATGIPQLQFARDGRYLILGSDQGVVTFDCDRFRQYSTFSTDPVCSLASSPDGRHLLLQTKAGSVQLWNLRTQRVVAELTHPGPALLPGSAEFSPTGNQILSCGSNRIRVWKFNGIEEKLVLGGHTQTASCVAFSPSDPVVASGSRDGTVSFWDTRSGKQLKQVQTTEEVEAIAFSPCGSLVAVVSNDSFRIWDSRDPQHSDVTYRRHGQKAFRDVCFSPDGKWVATCGNQGTQVWQVLAAEVGRPPQLRLHSDRSLPARTIAFDSNSRYVAVATLQQLSWFPLDSETQNHKTGQRVALVSQLVASDEPHTVSAVAADRTIHRWDLETQQVTKRAFGSEGLRSCNLAVSPAGRIAAVTANPTQIQLLDLELEKPIFRLAEESAAIASVAWDPSGKKLAVGLMDGSVAVWNVAAIMHQLYSADLAGDLDLFRDSMPMDLETKSVRHYQQTWQLVDSEVMQQRHAAQILHEWNIETRSKPADAEAVERGVPRSLLQELKAFGGAISSSGAFALAVPAKHLDALVAELTDCGYQLQALRPYLHRGDLAFAATWFEGERKSYYRTSMSRHEMLVQNERMVGSGFRLVDLGGYLREPNASAENFYGVWCRSSSPSGEQLLILGATTDEAEGNFDYLQHRHRLSLRQLYFDPQGNRKLCSIWQALDDGKADRWFAFWGPKKRFLEESLKHADLPVGFLNIAQSPQGSHLLYSGVGDNSVRQQDVRVLLDVTPRLMQLVGSKMLETGYRPVSVSVTTSKFTELVAAAIWEKDGDDAGPHR